ncbi:MULTISPECIES: DNA repair protein RadA [Thalassobaculum]|uniref:DNA repair protein RadA n=1 Tax=Thalassobaculum litoreum DSM 18839 TaxID=1123362 RepID=A0A8G2BH91_9PROT|nr:MULTISPECIES: DNA repair protein RadA [Thalassobaculum]SDF68265.1 DNA replication and repair protein RadA [Thalassobaculum litoreum DSM 18839]
MAKSTSRYVCQECGSVTAKWAGKCDACGAWNTLVEEVVEAAPKGLKPGGGRRINFVELAGQSKETPRRITGIGEFDRVLGGGLVPGSATLIGGDPGIGKSTVLLQVVAGLSGTCRCAYVSGEEAVDQVRMRAQRLGVAGASVGLAAATSVRDIVSSLEAADSPDVVVIDSIQTMYVDALDSAPGTVAQVRASAQELIRVAKKRGIALLLVGHVTKEGAIAGPRVLEHMVDTVLYFEGERGHQFRILRGVKNRFGPTDEIGVFEMTEGGLMEVTNPSALFLSDRQDDISGACVFAGVEGTRPVLVEIQALIAPSPYGTPRRAVVGWDGNRLAMVTAVLEARCGVSLAGNDVFLNVAGGLRVSEPAADLAVAAALLSSLTGVPVPKGSVVFGEIGLSAEVRAVTQAEARLKEAAKLGFEKALLPASRRKGGKALSGGLDLVEISRLHDLVDLLHDPGDDARIGRRVVAS